MIATVKPEPATDAENIAWLIVVLDLIVVIVASITFFVQSGEYDGDPAGAAMVLGVAVPLLGLGLVPALILMGLRQLLPRLRSVPGGEKVTDAENG